MKLLLSWSGKLSGDVAQVLREYLPLIMQELDVFMSKHDLESGGRWSNQLAEQLQETSFGIICLTKDNLHSPWILFEAGALSKHAIGRACGLLFGGLAPADVTGPLSQFQNRSFNRQEFAALLNDVNAYLGTPLDPRKLDRLFEEWWPHIEKRCAQLMAASVTPDPSPQRDSHELLEEIVVKVRDIERLIAGGNTPAPRELVAPADATATTLRYYYDTVLHASDRLLLAAVIRGVARSELGLREKEIAAARHRLIKMGWITRWEGEVIDVHRSVLDALHDWPRIDEGLGIDTG